MIVDDNQSVHDLVRMVLRDFTFEGRPLKFVSGYSGREAIGLMHEHTDTAILLLDVVMESDRAGLDVVHAVRQMQGNHQVRIVILTGQPGLVPAREIINEYDINEYREKTELNAVQMVDLMMTSLRSFRDLSTIERLNEKLRRNQKKLNRSKSEEEVFSALLRLSLRAGSEVDFLHSALDHLLESVPWLSLLPKGGVFLMDREEHGRAMTLVAQHNLPPGVLNSCARMPLGRCLCGKAAAEGRVQFAECVDARHEILYEAIEPHGHYCVPILSEDEVLGVIVLYLPEGGRRADVQEDFLRRVAEVFSLSILKKRNDADIEHMAYHDALTGLPNRALLLDRLQGCLAAAKRGGHNGALLYLDLDRFKTLNDALGHALGDLLLQQIARRLSDLVRAGDTVARLGGDEFVVLIPDLGRHAGRAAFTAHNVANKIRETVSNPFNLQGHRHHVTFSTGIVVFPQHGKSAGELLKHGDTAMYRAKNEEGNSVCFYLPSMQVEANRRLSLEKDLRRAIEKDELALYYQVQADALGSILGAEALLRWHHPEKGLILPADFIPIAEETGLIPLIGEWVIRQACSFLNAWSGPQSENASAAPRIAVNVSPRQFHQARFAEKIEQILHETRADPCRLMVELTEGVFVRDIPSIVHKMQALKALGVLFAIDDFGTGYSSLSLLKRLPVDELKIDQSFVRHIETDSNDAAIIDTILAIASKMGVDVVAEGVETRSHLEILLHKGCRSFQGYYFSRPLPPAEFIAFAQRGSVPLRAT